MCVSPSQVTAVALLMLSAACTSSSHTARQPTVAPQSSSLASSTPSGTCARDYPATTTAESAVAGDLRFFGPRPLNAVGNFAAQPDNAPVALCLVPNGNGDFTVYGIPQASGRAQRLWVQNEGAHFVWPI
ncbi:MAG: hypothetical protein JWP14_553 [Frankiales bacterium]|nr:hypothetical protein [Frankiales bacterium]